MRNDVPPVKRVGGHEEPTAGARAGSPGIHTALSVLETIVSRGPLTLSELAGHLRIPKSSVHRACSVMVERDWALRREDGRYDLGIRAIGLGARSSELPILTAFRGISAELLTRHDETVCLAVLDGDESMYIAMEETSQPVRLVTHVGSRTPAFASASGRVILADRSPQVVAAEYAGRALVTPTGRRLRGVQELLEILAEVRGRGYAENREETAVGLHTISVPIRGLNGATLAGLTICVPTSRMGPGRRERIIEDLLSVGPRFSESVSWLSAWKATRAEVHAAEPATAGR